VGTILVVNSDLNRWSRNYSDCSIYATVAVIAIRSMLQTSKPISTKDNTIDDRRLWLYSVSMGKRKMGIAYRNKLSLESRALAL
jgi:hypothetical protein